MIDWPPADLRVRSAERSPAIFRSTVQILSLLLVFGDWIAFYRWGLELLPGWRMNIALALYLTMLGVWVVTFVRYRARSRDPADADNAWFDYVVSILLASALCGLGLKWLENPFADEERQALALTMSTGYIALASFSTIRPPGAKARGFLGSVTPVVQLPAMYFFWATEDDYLSVSLLLSLTIYAALMLGVREYIQMVADISHARLVTAQNNLARSEEARRRLEVDHALEVERERLMREVHDGIGSSLVTALALAQREDHPKPTVDLLRRALSDLKLTVDSLDTVDGDVLALLGNLRHRLEPDLRRAGLAAHWDVRDCPPLTWLDPNNALQFLRLIQEAVSNALAHSGASTLIFRCKPAEMAGKSGIRVELEDDGKGMDPALCTGGRGFSTMRARAKTLQAAFACHSSPGKGTRIEIWLPYVRG